jgi:hypothetical protein
MSKKDLVKYVLNMMVDDVSSFGFELDDKTDTITYYPSCEIDPSTFVRVDDVKVPLKQVMIEAFMAAAEEIEKEEKAQKDSLFELL